MSIPHGPPAAPLFTALKASLTVPNTSLSLENVCIALATIVRTGPIAASKPVMIPMKAFILVDSSANF